MLLSHRRLFAVVHDTAKRYNCRFEELLGEGYISLKKLEAKEDYSKEKDTKTTYYWRWIESLLRYSIYKEKQYFKRGKEVSNDIINKIEHKKEVEFEFPERLSQEGKFVAKMALNLYYEEAKIPSKGEIKKKLIEKGWKLTIVNKIFAELRNVF